MCKLTFEHIEKCCPEIHASSGNWGEEGEIVKLSSMGVSSKKDFNEHTICGSGTLNDPYYIEWALTTPVYFLIIELWIVLRRFANSYYIKINKWIFQITPTGIRAADGYYTNLLP